jgi:heme exporter protein B
LSTLRAARAILWKDLRSERRSREMLSAMLVFALLVIFIFNFALALDAGARASVTAGVLWTTLAFAGSLGLNRSFNMEREQGGLDGLLLAPAGRTAIYLAKLALNLLSILLTAAVIFPLYSLFYNTNLLYPQLALVVLLASLGYASTGTLLAAMAVQARTRDILLPILLFPLILPLLLAAVKFTGGILAGTEFTELRTWFDLIVVYDLVFMGLSIILFDWVIEE